MKYYLGAIILFVLIFFYAMIIETAHDRDFSSKCRALGGTPAYTAMSGNVCIAQTITVPK